MIETILYIIFNVIIFVLFYAYIDLYIKFKITSNFLVEEKMEKENFQLKLADYISQNDSNQLEQTEGFVDFISQSRNWAFKYIEDIQASLLKLREAIDILKSETGNTKNVEKAIIIVEDILKYLPEDKP